VRPVFPACDFKLVRTGLVELQCIAAHGGIAVLAHVREDCLHGLLNGGCVAGRVVMRRIDECDLVGMGKAAGHETPQA